MTIRGSMCLSSFEENITRLQSLGEESITTLLSLPANLGFVVLAMHTDLSLKMMSLWSRSFSPDQYGDIGDFTALMGGDTGKILSASETLARTLSAVDAARWTLQDFQEAVSHFSRLLNRVQTNVPGEQSTLAC